MPKAKSVVGLDVHAAEIVAAVFEVETGTCAGFALRFFHDQIYAAAGRQ